MLITSNALNAQLQTSWQIYTLFGEEEFLVMRSLHAIYRTLAEQGIEYKVQFSLEANSSFEKVFDEVYNTSLFSPHKIIELRLSSLATKVTTNLLKLLQTLPQGVTLIVIIGEIRYAQHKTKWFTELDTHSLIVEHKTITEDSMLAWVVQEMKALGIVVDKRIAEHIATYNTYNLPGAYNELQKIKFAYGDGTINTEEVLAQLLQNSKYSIYSLMDNALLGRAQQVQKIYALQNFEPMYIINLLYTGLKQLIAVQVQVKQKIALPQALKNAGVWKNKENIVKSALSRHSYPELQKMLLTLGRVERSVKGRDYLNVGDTLLSLLLTLASHYEHH